MLHVAVTIDVDPDANRAIPGRVDTRSTRDGRVYVEACRRGLDTTASLLDSLALPGTFFWEARTLRVLANTDPALVHRLARHGAREHGCHGLRHEDFSGRETGVMPRPTYIRNVLGRATDILSSILDCGPRGFRAPYCRMTGPVADVLREIGYRYDASSSRRPGREWQMLPYPLPDGQEVATLWEVPLMLWRDAEGELISGYLWRLLENDRPEEHYVRVARELADRFPGGLLQLALHPWHLTVDENGHPHDDPKATRMRLQHTLENIFSLENVRFTTVGDFLESHLEALR